MKNNTFIKKGKPLFFNEKGNLLFSRLNKVYERSENGEEVLLFEFDEKLINKVLGNFSLWHRMKRLGVMSAISSEEHYFFSYSHHLIVYDRKNRSLKVEFKFNNGRGPLHFCNIIDILGFTDSICYGEYFGNHNRNPVSIFQREACGKWKNAFQFSEGKINHIHALIPDKKRCCVWILVGDFEHSAAIYMAKNNFNDVELIVEGKQSFRSCIAFPTDEGLLYATDTQQESNSIRLLRNEFGTWDSEKLYEIKGSCIYGTELKDYYVFSTSTEPSDEPKGKLSRLIDNKPGPGIKDNSSDIIVYSKEKKEFNILSTVEKDIFPYRIFQFGSIMFPSGKASNNHLFAYNVGSKKNDLSTEVFYL